MSSIQTTQNGLNIFPELKTKETQIREFYSSSFYIIITTIITISYSLLWTILIIVYTEKDSLPSNCNKLIRCNRVIYSFLILSIIITLITSIIQLVNSNFNLIAKLLLIKTLYHYIVGLSIVIAITVIYYKTDDVELCDKMRKVDYAYIITEWIIVGSCSLCYCGILWFVICCKAKPPQLNRDGEVSDEEMKKIYDCKSKV